MRNKFTKQAQTALTLAKAAAIDFELGYIGTEHLLLGLLSETEGTAGRVLEEFQVDGKKLVIQSENREGSGKCSGRGTEFWL